MATFTSSKLLLLDEKHAALDPAPRKKVLKITREVVAEHRITTLMSPNNMHLSLDGNRR
jgi:putative ABC transport system ATP-binding protein